MGKYGTIVTDAGRELLAAAAAQGTSAQITEIAVGDGGGMYYAPTPDQTALRREVWRGKAGKIVQDKNVVRITGVIPADVGGFTVREIAVCAADGTIIALAVLADVPKPNASEGMGVELRIGMALVLEEGESITVVMDPNTVTATLKDLEAHNTDPDAHKELLDGLRPYEFATTEEAVAGENEDKIMSPKRVKESVLSNAPAPDIDGAITARIATSAEAGAGTDDTKLMTPKKVKEVISSIDTAYIRKDTNAPIDADWVPAVLSISAVASSNSNTIITDGIDNFYPEKTALIVGRNNNVVPRNNFVVGASNNLPKSMCAFTLGNGNKDGDLDSTEPSCYNITCGVQNEVTNSQLCLVVGGHNKVGGEDAGGPSGLMNVFRSACIGEGHKLKRTYHSLLVGQRCETLPNPDGWPATSAAALGLGLLTGSGALVCGTYNKYTPVDNDPRDLFIVGNGTRDVSRSNAFRVSSTGAVYGTGAYNTSGADYAEYFEWQDENPDNEDRRGRFVTLEGEKIRFAQPGEYVLGVVSAAPSVVGDAASEDWQGKYERDVFGQILYGEDGARKLNPAFKPEDDAGYTGREKRKEWAAVGMVGKLAAVDDGSCQVNGYCQPGADGIAVSAETGYRVIARLDDTHVKIVVK